MPSKYQIISAMAAEQALDIISNAGKYTAFLTTAANNYKYSFREQLLIHAQKPTATACADVETWNKLGLWVNKGTKGIALLLDGNGPYRLRHVFDVSDTHSFSGRSVNLWRMEPRFENAVNEALGNRFGELSEHGDFADDLMRFAAMVVEDNLPDYHEQLLKVRENSFLEELDDYNVGVWLKDVLKSSVGYMLLTRCGYPALSYYTAGDFLRVYDFNTLDTVAFPRERSTNRKNTTMPFFSASTATERQGMPQCAVHSASSKAKRQGVINTTRSFWQMTRMQKRYTCLNRQSMP